MMSPRNSPAHTFTAEQFLAGFALAGTDTVTQSEFNMPRDAETFSPWTIRGAFYDYFWICATNTIFRLGTNDLTDVRVSTHGLIEFGGNNSRLAVFPHPISVIPQYKWKTNEASRIWYRRKPDGVTAITWENFYFNRNTDHPVSFQAELCPNGNFIYRYGGEPDITNCLSCYAFNNGIATVIRPRQNTAYNFAYIADLDPENHDFDNDDVDDIDEVAAGTDPRHPDTDRDGVNDGQELIIGYDPLDPDSDGDGIADGSSAEQLAANPILAQNALHSNLVLSFASDDVNAKGVFNIDGLPLIVTNSSTLFLNLPHDRTVDFGFYSKTESSFRILSSGANIPVMAEDPEGIFRNRSPKTASGRIIATDLLTIASIDEEMTGTCIHDIPGIRHYSVYLGDGEWEFWRKYAIVTGVNANTSLFTLAVNDTPSSVSSLSVAFPQDMMLWGKLSASASIHRCEAGYFGFPYCRLCGHNFYHTESIAVTPTRQLIGVNTGDTAVFTVGPSSYVQNPEWSITPNYEGGPVLTSDGASATVSAGSVPGIYQVTASGEGCSASATLVVYSVDYLTLESSAFRSSRAPVHFPGMTKHEFDPTRSPVPDLHQPLFFNDAQTSSCVSNIAVDLCAHFNPVTVAGDELDCHWALISDCEDGTFTNADSPVAHFTPESGGGVYRFSFSCGSLSNSEAVLVLPLAGTSVDSIMGQVLIKADSFCTAAEAKYTPFERNSIKFGWKHFVKDGNGDFRGRADSYSISSRTARYYNQVDDETGLGSVCTWYGVPVRTSKLSNFVVGYACEKLGVASVPMYFAQLIGTGNDEAAELSWEAGVETARSTNYVIISSSLVSNIWNKADDKNIKLWPNTAATDNYVDYFISPNERFTHPGFINIVP